MSVEAAAAHEPAAADASDERAAPGEERSLVDALERVTQASVEILEGRAELIQLEIRAAGARLVAGALRAVSAGLLFVAAWVALMGAAFVALRGTLGDVASLAAVAGANALLGALVLAIGRRDEG